MTAGGAVRGADAGLRVVAIADSDSYVKWAAALLGAAPEGADVSLIIVETPVVVSPAQQRAALSGSQVDAARVRRMGHEALATHLSALRPDAVLIAARGPLARVLARTVASLRPRPVLVTGLPGISIPATSAALTHRLQCDLFVLHSTREITEFTRLAARRGLDHRFALARLPFVGTGAGGSPAEEDAAAATESGLPGVDVASGTDLVFAAQAIVPRERLERLHVARLLIAAALADPAKRVVVKLRAVRGEKQTHRERDAFEELLAGLGPLPVNLVISAEPMAHALDRAEGLLTISSTAAIEAVARGIPVIALDTFGVSDELINPVFRTSGLLAGDDDVIARAFRHPRTEWLRENYFHDPARDDWYAQLSELVEQRRRGTLTPKTPRARRGGRARDAWEHKLAFGRYDRSLAGNATLVVGVPVQFALRGIAVVRRALAPAPQPHPSSETTRDRMHSAATDVFPARQGGVGARV